MLQMPALARGSIKERNDADVLLSTTLQIGVAAARPNAVSDKLVDADTNQADVIAQAAPLAQSDAAEAPDGVSGETVDAVSGEVDVIDLEARPEVIELEESQDEEPQALRDKDGGLFALDKVRDDDLKALAEQAVQPRAERAAPVQALPQGRSWPAGIHCH